MGMMKGLYTKIQLGNRLDKDEKAFIKKYCTKPNIEETAQLDIFEYWPKGFAGFLKNNHK